MILDSPIDVQDSKERVLFDISGKRIVDTVNYPLKKLRINVLADCFSSKIGLKRKNMGITSNRVIRESHNPSVYWDHFLVTTCTLFRPFSVFFSPNLKEEFPRFKTDFSSAPLATKNLFKQIFSCRERESKIQVTLTLQKKTRYNASDNLLKKIVKKEKTCELTDFQNFPWSQNHFPGLSRPNMPPKCM